MKELAAVNTLKDVPENIFVGSSTGNLLVSQEKDIEKLYLIAAKLSSVHSEDENILLSRKKFRKKEMLLHIRFGANEECALRIHKKSS